MSKEEVLDFLCETIEYLINLDRNEREECILEGLMEVKDSIQKGITNE